MLNPSFSAVCSHSSKDFTKSASVENPILMLSNPLKSSQKIYYYLMFYVNCNLVFFNSFYDEGILYTDVGRIS